jgi:hypothetical protein
MNVKAKRTRYHFAFCKWIHGLAAAFIAKQGISNYPKDAAVMDLFASAQNKILTLLSILLQNFLAAYKAATNLLGGIPTPTVTYNFEDKINHINNTPRLKTTENAIASFTALAKREDTDIQDNGKNEQEMINATNAVKTAAIGGRATICRVILDAINKGTIEPIQKFHLQRKENNKTRHIKAAFTLPRLNKAAQRVATAIANEPPAQMPVLCGLVQEMTAKSTSAMERRLQSLKDQLKAVQGGKKSQKKSRAAGRKKTPQGS